MKAFAHRYATPLIAGFFAISLISGLGLFLRVGPVQIRPMHEWLSVVLIVPFALHLWKNWRALLRYLTGRPFAAAMMVALVAALAFFVPMGQATGRGRPAQFALARKVMDAPLTAVAAVMGQTPESLRARLQGAGFTVAGIDLSPAAIAAASGRSESQMAAALTAAGG